MLVHPHSAGPLPGAPAAATALFALSQHDPKRAAAEASGVLAGPEPRGAAAVAVAQGILAETAWQDGDAVAGLRPTADAVSDADGMARTWVLHSKLAVAGRLGSLGEYTQAMSLIRCFGDELTHSDSAFHKVTPMIAMARLFMQAGRLEEALHEAEQAWRMASRLGADLLVTLTGCVLASITLRLGDLEASQRYLRQSAHRSGGFAPATQWWSVQADWVDVQLTAELHGPQDAADMLDAKYPLLATSRSLILDEPSASAWFVRLGNTVKDKSIAMNAILVAEEIANRNPRLAQLAVSARHARGLVDRDIGALAAAAVEHRDPWAQAGAMEDLADRLGEEPGAHLGRTIAVLQSASDNFSAMDANLDASRIAGKLRRLNADQQPQLSSGIGGGSSTTEKAIVAMVGQGLTNSQIGSRLSLSSHTVNYHLRKIFRRLSIKSRVELAALGARRPVSLV
jgi:ATP/maltotriose-dependent transcriptional regulator MalT